MTGLNLGMQTAVNLKRFFAIDASNFIKMKRVLWCCLCFSWPLSAATVVVNTTVPLESLSQAQLRNIFTMRQEQWPDGTPVRVIVLPSASTIHQRFSKEQLRLFPYQLSSIWDRLSFSGTGRLPQQAANEAVMLQMISAVPGSIGYVENYPGHPKTRELRIEN